MVGRQDDIHYIFLIKTTSHNKEFSLNVKDSDYNIHESILNSVVGTLVKYSSAGIIEPYLAEHYNVSNDGLTWTYTLRDNLFCDDGTPINAESYSIALGRQLKLYSKSGTPMDFGSLAGFNDFISSHESSFKFPGIESIDNKISFHFERRPEDLNELLRMPYFGFWCPANLGTLWDHDTKFISSGPYRISNETTKTKIVVEKRSNWFSIDEKSVPRIKFSYESEQSLSKLIENGENLIIETSSRYEVPKDTLRNVRVVDSPPTSLATLVISPTVDGPFKALEIRQAFLNRVREYQDKFGFGAKFFYFGARSSVSENSSRLVPFKNRVKIRVAFLGDRWNEIDQLSSFLNEVFNSMNLDFEFLGQTPNEKNWIERVLSNNEFEMRFTSVSVGSYISNFINKMIFCSNLGARYPDPSGGICALTAQIENKSSVITNDYISRFNQVIYDDASVIPMKYFGTRWLLTENINKENFPSTPVALLYEDIRLL